MRAFLTFFLVLFHLNILAFDCKKAKTATEKTICMHSDLMKFENEMNRLYKEYTEQYYEDDSKQKQFVAAQKLWLSKREKDCAGEPECIKTWTTSHIFKLIDLTQEYQGDSDFLWEGAWVEDTDFESMINITECKKNKCDISIILGSRSCEMSGDIRIFGDKARFFGGPHDEKCKINLVLNKALKMLTISKDSYCKRECNNMKGGAMPSAPYRRYRCFQE